VYFSFRCWRAKSKEVYDGLRLLASSHGEVGGWEGGWGRGEGGGGGGVNDWVNPLCMPPVLPTPRMTARPNRPKNIRPLRKNWPTTHLASD
jgi:hypothetical protein